jgi:hypothetical protein
MRISPWWEARATACDARRTRALRAVPDSGAGCDPQRMAIGWQIREQRPIGHLVKIFMR